MILSPVTMCNGVFQDSRMDQGILPRKCTRGTIQLVSPNTRLNSYMAKVDTAIRKHPPCTLFFLYSKHQQVQSSTDNNDPSLISSLFSYRTIIKLYLIRFYLNNQVSAKSLSDKSIYYQKFMRTFYLTLWNPFKLYSRTEFHTESKNRF